MRTACLQETGSETFFKHVHKVLSRNIPEVFKKKKKSNVKPSIPGALSDAIGTAVVSETQQRSIHLKLCPCLRHPVGLAEKAPAEVQ